MKNNRLYEGICSDRGVLYKKELRVNIVRKEKEIINSIIDTALRDNAVRAVVRTDLLPRREYLYTYNFYFIVNDIEKYDNDKIFEECFGKRILLYRADKNYQEMFPNIKAHLMVLEEGLTIVIHVMDRETFLRKYNVELRVENAWNGNTYQKVLDKDDSLPQMDCLEEKQLLYAKKPTEAEFMGICNEFWWVLKTFAEYTLREELVAAMFYLNVAVRDLLNKMLRWYLYLQAEQPVELGILDSNLEKVLDKELFVLYKQTYPTAEYECMWAAYNAVVELWCKTGNVVAKLCGYDYPNKVAKDMSGFIHRLKLQRKGNM